MEGYNKLEKLENEQECSIRRNNVYMESDSILDYAKLAVRVLLVYLAMKKDKELIIKEDSIHIKK